MSTMNITIIIPALQLPPAGRAGRKDSGSPQPTTPFPPINLSPSPTPTLSISQKSTPTATTPIILHDTSTVITTTTRTTTSRMEKHNPIILSRDNSMNDESFEDYYEDDTFLLPLTSASETPPAELPSSSQQATEDNSIDGAMDSSIATLMHHEEVSVGNNHNRTDEDTASNTDDENFEGLEDTIIIQSAATAVLHASDLQDGLPLQPSRHSANSDTISIDSRPTESNSSPETVIHILKSSNPDSENEANDPINQSTTTSSSHYRHSHSLSAKQTLVRQNSMYDHSFSGEMGEQQEQHGELIEVKSPDASTQTEQDLTEGSPEGRMAGEGETVIIPTARSNTTAAEKLPRTDSAASHRRSSINRSHTIASENHGSEADIANFEPKAALARANTVASGNKHTSSRTNSLTSQKKEIMSPVDTAASENPVQLSRTDTVLVEKTDGLARADTAVSEGKTSLSRSDTAGSEHKAPTSGPDTINSENRASRANTITQEKSLDADDSTVESAQKVTLADSDDKPPLTRAETMTTDQPHLARSTTDAENRPSLARSETLGSIQSAKGAEDNQESIPEPIQERPNHSRANTQIINDSHQVSQTEHTEPESEEPEPPQISQESSTSITNETAEVISTEPQELITQITEKDDIILSSAPPEDSQAPLQPPTIITTPASAKSVRAETLGSLSHQTSEDRQSGEEETELDLTRPSEGDEQTDGDKYETVDESDAHQADESLQDLSEVIPSPKPKKRLKSTRKGRTKVFPNPRKPSNYPQRMNKATLARQALAREKRRVYVEERIQSYIKNAQANNIPIAIPTGALATTVAQVSSTRHQEEEQQRKTAAVKTTIKNTTTTTTTTTVQHKVETPTPTVNELQAQILHSKSTAPSHPIPAALDANNYYLNNPISVPPPPQNLSAIQVARVHNHHHHRRTPFKPPLSVASSSIHSSIGLPSMRTVPSVVPDTSLQQLQQQQQRGSEWVKQTIFAIPSAQNVMEAVSSEKTWKGVEHHGYFYSFRVRQSGPVQMMDKGVQTGSANVTTTSPQSHSYTLSFSETHSTNSSFIVSTHPVISHSSAHVETSQSEQTSGPQNIDDRDKILREITETVQLRHDAELRRAELVQRANDLQMRVKEKRDKINRRHEFWHKKYIEESSLTRPLEASCSSLRAELNTVHRRLLAHLEGRDLPLRLRDGPSKKANYKIMAARLQHEIKELQQKVKAAKLKLESEIKLKEQADREVREIRNDLAHKKVVMSLARSQVSTLPAVHPRVYDPLIY